ncbi:MAG: ERCC4 domain-containing protein [Candidatus Anstonellales archaeon]
MNKQMLLINAIIVDAREPDYIINELKKKADIEIKQIPLADYVISNTAIERKSAEDFENSIIDGRLFRQCKELKEHFDNVILILEGSQIRLDKKIWNAAIASIAISGITIIRVNDWLDTVDIIVNIKQKLEKEGEDFVYIVKDKKPLSLDEQKIFLLSSIKGIGKKRAKAIIENFKTLKRLANADKEEIEKLPGFGSKRAKILFDIFNM